MRSQEYQSMADLEDVHWWFLAKRLFVKTLFFHIKKSPIKILDVGCGTGGMTAFMSQWGEVTGVENSEKAHPFLKMRRLKYLKGSANKLPVKRLSFDLVTFFDVLYHKRVKEDDALQGAYKALKTNGYLLITDSALPWLWSTHDEIMQGKKRYSKKELVSLVEKNGFTILKVSYIFFSTLPFIAIVRLYQKQSKNFSRNVTMPPKLINSCLTQLMRLESNFLKWVDFPLGSSIIILAQKK